MGLNSKYRGQYGKHPQRFKGDKQAAVSTLPVTDPEILEWNAMTREEQIAQRKGPNKVLDRKRAATYGAEWGDF